VLQPDLPSVVKPAPFAYESPGTLADAVELLDRYGDDAKVLAGGQSLVPMLALRLARFERLIDLNGIAELQTIERIDGRLRVGSMVRQATAEHHPEVAAAAPLLARALPHIGHVQIRNRGTVGGSTVHADPASELPAVALALDAELELVGLGGTRVVPAAEFFVSMWTTAIGDGEILAAIRYPSWGERSGFAVREFARRPGDFALAGAACAVSLDSEGIVTHAAIGMFGVGPTPIRGTAAEAALIGQPAGGPLDEIVQIAARATDPRDDIHGTAAYRRILAVEMVGRALRVAIEEATA
jgi:carbon-monoxide dehydrogenase medium subunit